MARTTLTPSSRSDSIWQHRHVYHASLVAYLSGVTAGATLLYTSPALPNLNANPNPFHVDSEEATWAASLFSIGGLLGALLCGPTVDRYGRKLTTMLSMVLTPLGCLLIVAANRPWVLCVGRFLTGISCGAAILCSSLYTIEVSPATHRGILMIIGGIAIHVGNLLTTVAGAFLPWNWLAILHSAMGVVCVTGMLFVPETPYWYLMKNRKRAAEKALIWLRRTNDVSDLSVIERHVVLQSNPESKANWREFGNKSIWHPMLLATLIMMFHDASGVHAFQNYTVSIFQSTGSTLDPFYETIIVYAIGLVASMVGCVVIKYVNRKPMFITSCAFAAVSLAAFGAYFWIQERNPTFCMNYLSWLPITSLSIFTMFDQFGITPLAFGIGMELIPARVRGKGTMIINAVHWIMTFATSKVYVSLARVLGEYGQFWMYSGIVVVCIIFAIIFLPETKDIPLEVIEEMFQNEKKSSPDPKSKTLNSEVESGL